MLSLEEQMSKDLLSVKDLIKHGLKLIVRPEKVSRVGRRKEGKDRLIVVTLQDDDDDDLSFRAPQQSCYMAHPPR